MNLFAPPAPDRKPPDWKGQRLILLDLNFTLAEPAPGGGFRPGPHETYRGWLIELLRRHKAPVVMVTVRREGMKKTSLDRIRELHDWAPADAYFRTNDMDPPTWKRRVWRTMIVPKYRIGPADALAIESNNSTKAMYDAERIAHCSVARGGNGLVWPGMVQPQASLPT